ncbi:UDP-N-acetylmuramoyl-tripeptide--D-alanyl-D-alanine ligase [Phaeovulum vinaykumarii]|uniref:UDP-N-acetylmuramoyl-tripeptide--D-alanyl-D-alanine ligase n=1 Tax=Phaeovulum vinaykumarii TaxID=407234 RepID=A0A1N7JTI7_9RHOB|nr:UDP-N-acetylmuramoyl-tripeptide--D-alanyl-D-alanine ligase [Phaeovulum vinaykumarii]SIS52625.1 UDP-N-acetylmuramoyl-tripeptide--D-alanyl-D-alanine ligase [Phaeovulum vinaykumarii]SOB91300.1 UDP-N-acetylmuramoyl-tripeptide--D-alanyl-D-alanine ligase [Phaeovulum vinaykumarii]
MAVLWTGSEIEGATGGRLCRPFTASGVSIDTRSLKPGDLFVALTDVRDGHDFVAQALAAGAGGALVSRVPEGVAPDAPLVIVPDVLAGLTALGAAGRARAAARVIAVTGSVGKTSTKEMLRAVLAPHGKVHAAEASFNNHWGVPVTLARLDPRADFAVVEIGMNHPGEIAPLARLTRPDAALITTIAAAHLEAFDGLEGIAAEKADIFQGLAPGGVAIVPAGLPVSPILFAAAHRHAARVLGFGAEAGADWRLVSSRIAEDATVVEAERAGAPVLFKIATPGRHFAMNALGVLALAEGLGLDPAVVACDLGQWEPPAGRGRCFRVQIDTLDDGLSFDLYDDAFNANPASMEAAFEVLAAAAPQDGLGRVRHGRRVAILGDMLELGPDEMALHAALADHPAMQSFDVVHCVGPRMRALWEVLPPGRRGEWHETARKMAERAVHLADAGDVILVKGSKGSKVSIVVEALRKRAQGKV